MPRRAEKSWLIFLPVLLMIQLGCQCGVRTVGLLTCPVESRKSRREEIGDVSSTCRHRYVLGLTMKEEIGILEIGVMLSFSTGLPEAWLNNFKELRTFSF